MDNTSRRAQIAQIIWEAGWPKNMDDCFAAADRILTIPAHPQDDRAALVDAESLCAYLDNGSLVVDEDGATMDLELFHKILDLVAPALSASAEASEPEVNAAMQSKCPKCGGVFVATRATTGVRSCQVCGWVDAEVTAENLRRREAQAAPGVYTEEQALSNQQARKEDEELRALLQRAEVDLRIDATRYAESGHTRAAQNRMKTADRLAAYRKRIHFFGRGK